MRAFIAIEVPDFVSAAVARAQADLSGRIPAGAVRWTRPDAHHLTLYFLGSIEPQDVPGYTDVMTAAARHVAPLDLSLTGIGCFPSTRHPSVIWVGIGGDMRGLGDLHARLGDLLGHPGTVSHRPFRPHVTLGRVKGRLRLAPDTLGAVSVPVTGWTADSVVLFESKLLPAGAQYRRVTSTKLGG